MDEQTDQPEMQVMRDLQEIACALAEMLQQASAILSEEDCSGKGIANAMARDCIDKLKRHAEEWETFRALASLQHSILEREANK